MSSSLQEQLLKAGLVDERKAKQVNKQKQKQANQARKAKAPKGKPENTAAKQRAEKRAARDRQLNQERQERLRQKEIAAQIKQLIEDNRLDRSKAEITYRFEYKKKVKTILVTEEQKTALGRGHLAIVTMVLPNERRFDLVKIPIAEKITERDETAVIRLDGEKKSKVEDDAYADYEIPDDLMW